MSQIVAQFDPTTSTSTQFSAPNSAGNGALVFFNESQNSIVLQFTDGSNLYLPAWYHRHKCGSTGSVNISWQIHTVLSSGPPPLSLVIVESFTQGEHYPADGPLVRQANGEVNSTVNSNTLVNVGNPAGTKNIIEIANTTSSGDITTVDNNGNFVNGNAAFPGTISLDNGKLATDGAGHFILSNNIALQIKDTSGTAQNAISGSTTNDLHIQPLGAAQWIYLDGGNGVNICTFRPSTDPNAGLNMNGLTVVANNGVNFNVGRIKDFNNGSNLSGTINHGLSGTPAAVLATCNSSGSTATTGASNYTSTQFQLNVGSSLNARWIAYR